jgi:UDP:flavonoid glycosyltransferase YjiC (YdhE family)
MKKYLLTTLPSNDLGLLTRSLPIAQELVRLGDEVSFCHPARTPRLLIKEAGFKNRLPEDNLFRLISSEFSLQNISNFLFSKKIIEDIRILSNFYKVHTRNSTDEIWDIDHFLIFFGLLDEEFVQRGVDSHIDLIKRSKAEAVIDFWNPFACIAARAIGMPLITIIQADMHPQSNGFIWWKEKPDNLPSSREAVNQVLKKYRLQPIGQVEELFVGDLTLLVGIPDLDPLPDSAEVTYIGPILWQKEDAKLPDWIYHLNENQPIVWVYPGNLQYAPGGKSAFDSQIVLDASIDAFADQDLQVVVTTGLHKLPKRYQNLPANFWHAPYLPGLAMAEVSDLLIHHGGYGSCQTGLFSGTPALVIPTFSERESNARRIATVMAGDYVLPTSDIRGVNKFVDPSVVREKAAYIMSNPAFLESVKDIQKKMESYGGAGEAAKLISNFSLQK